nr:uncharacterized protein LOC109191529 [Ipomoea batatas]
MCFPTLCAKRLFIVYSLSITKRCCCINNHLLVYIQGFVDELTSHTRTIATGLLKIARLVENALAAILDDERFKKIEYDECEERQGGDEIQAGDDRGHEVETAQASEGEVGEHKAHASERAQQIEVEIVAPTDEIYTVVNPQGENESRYKHFSSRYFEDKALAMDAPMA